MRYKCGHCKTWTESLCCDYCCAERCPICYCWTEYSGTSCYGCGYRFYARKRTCQTCGKNTKDAVCTACGHDYHGHKVISEKQESQVIEKNC